MVVLPSGEALAEPVRPLVRSVAARAVVDSGGGVQVITLPAEPLASHSRQARPIAVGEFEARDVQAPALTTMPTAAVTLHPTPSVAAGTPTTQPIGAESTAAPDQNQDNDVLKDVISVMLVALIIVGFLLVALVVAIRRAGSRSGLSTPSEQAPFSFARSTRSLTRTGSMPKESNGDTATKAVGGQAKRISRQSMPEPKDSEDDAVTREGSRVSFKETGSQRSRQFRRSKNPSQSSEDVVTRSVSRELLPAGGTSPVPEDEVTV